MWVMEEFSLLIDSMRLLTSNNSVVCIFFKSFLSILSCKIGYYCPAIMLNIHSPTTDRKMWIGIIFT